MSTNTRLPAEKSYFEQQREILLSEIAVSFEHVLANINKLNRSLEGVIAVGNEFSSVEALWSQFENVMGKEAESVGGGGGGAGAGGNGEGAQQQQRGKGRGERDKGVEEDEGDVEGYGEYTEMGEEDETTRM